MMSTSRLELEVMMRCSSGGTIVNNYPKSIVSRYFLRKKLETDEFLLGRAVTSSEPFDRSGPVPAAVRAAGYISEDEEETDEEGGSSMEEEETDDEQEADIVRSSQALRSKAEYSSKMSMIAENQRTTCCPESGSRRGSLCST